VTTLESDGVGQVAPGFDLAIANPPFIFEENAPAYRQGGDMHGAALSRDWTLAAARALAPGGRVLLTDPVRAHRLGLLEAMESDGWSVALSRWSVGEEAVEAPRPIGLYELAALRTAGG
jgi:methylase of polypeptide subunit release factors